MLPGIPELSLGQVLVRLGAALITVGVYGGVAALAARALGDRGPAHDGRLTVSPFSHLDLVGLFAAVFFRVTWPRPLAVDPKELKRPLPGASVLVLISTASLIALAAVALVARPLALRLLAGSAGLALANLLSVTYEVAIATALFNLVPIPPLLGEVVVRAARPGRLADAWGRPSTRIAGTVAAAVLLASGAATPVFRTLWRVGRELLGF